MLAPVAGRCPAGRRGGRRTRTHPRSQQPPVLLETAHRGRAPGKPRERTRPHRRCDPLCWVASGAHQPVEAPFPYTRLSRWLVAQPCFDFLQPVVRVGTQQLDARFIQPTEGLHLLERTSREVIRARPFAPCCRHATSPALTDSNTNGTAGPSPNPGSSPRRMLGVVSGAL
jgi:hypothetical protein